MPEPGSKTEYMFGHVPADLFRPFTGRSRTFFAELLAHLAENLFGHAGQVATRRVVLEAIREHIDRVGRSAVADDLAAEGVGGPTHDAAYNRLIQTGWLVQYQDRYRRVVDFDPTARLLLQTLLDIRDGRVRSYGGAVLNVLTLLESVMADPAEKALNVREAALAARGFMNHLRTVAGTMRRVEETIMAQPSAAALVRSFVADFIEATVVQDYRNLQSRESPFRFRSKIIDATETLLDDDEAIARASEGWVRGGIARDVASATPALIADLHETRKVFAGVDDHVEAIETTTYRIERRMTNIVRFSDRMATIGTDRILDAVAALGSTGLSAADEIGEPSPILAGGPPLTAQHMYLPARARRAPDERSAEVRPPDPALLRYLQAVDEFETRVAVSPDRLRAFVEEALGDADEIDAADVVIADLDGFLLLERIHEAGLHPLDVRYEFVEGDGTSATDWVERRDFTIRRRRSAHG